MAAGLPFHDRANELAAIRRAVASDRPELVVVYGRRGAGKSRLLSEAVSGNGHNRDKRGNGGEAHAPVFWYEATLRVLNDQLEDLTAASGAYARRAAVRSSSWSF